MNSIQIDGDEYRGVLKQITVLPRENATLKSELETAIRRRYQLSLGVFNLRQHLDQEITDNNKLEKRIKDLSGMGAIQVNAEEYRRVLNHFTTLTEEGVTLRTKLKKEEECISQLTDTIFNLRKGLEKETARNDELASMIEYLENADI